MSALVSGIKTIEQALGDGRKTPVARESEIAKVARKSIVAAQDIQIGTRLKEDLLALKRPGNGLSAMRLNEVLGKKALEYIPKGTVISLEMIE